MFFLKLMIKSCLIILVIFAACAIGISSIDKLNKPQKKDVSILEVNNPYWLGINTLFKCDYDNKKKKFKYVFKKRIKSKSQTIIEMPKDVIKCQIWVN